MSKGPPDSTEVGGGGKSDRNLDNNSESFDKHVSPLIEFSIDCCVLVRFCNF